MKRQPSLLPPCISFAVFSMGRYYMIHMKGCLLPSVVTMKRTAPLTCGSCGIIIFSTFLAPEHHTRIYIYIVYIV